MHLQSVGYNVVIISRDKDITTKLLDLYSLPHIKLTSAKSRISGILSELIIYQAKAHKILSEYKIDLALSIGGTFIAQACYLLKIPLIVFTDTEFNFSNKFSFPFAKIIATPTCYRGNLGSRQLRYNGYHELAYLHPNYFRADKTVLEEIGIKESEKFFVVRKTSGRAIEKPGRPDRIQGRLSIPNFSLSPVISTGCLPSPPQQPLPMPSALQSTPWLRSASPPPGPKPNGC